MFGKKICRKCNMKIKSQYDFCPYCGGALERRDEDFGMLGKTDSINESNVNMGLPGGFNIIFNSLMKNLEKQFKETQKNQSANIADKPANPAEKKGNISISISIGNKIPNMRINSSAPKAPKIRMKKSFEDMSDENLKRFSKLPKEEPKTSIRRLSNKVLYEIDIPGVKSSKDISILNLEKGIEFKAISDKKAYVKSIPINLPITRYKLSKGRLTLEMDTQSD